MQEYSLLKGLNQFAAEVHHNAVVHGWWEKELTFGDIIALCHCELSEAMEGYRKGTPPFYFVGEDGKPCYESCESWQMNSICNYCPTGKKEKPEGIAVELADCILRILDYCGKTGIDIKEAIYQKYEYIQIP